jgi:hypothetical protein
MRLVRTIWLGLLALFPALMITSGLAAAPQTQRPNIAVTAIDILLEPGATMLRHAEANNARLLKVYPNGFALDATHRPHITLIQRSFARQISTRSMPWPARFSRAPT